MNDINRKNAIYKINSIKGIPYDSIENVQHNGSELNSIVVNNAFAQLADNDLIISNTISRLNDYESGPKSYNEAQLSAAPSGYKMWVNEPNSNLSAIRKIDKDLSESIVPTSLADQSIKFMFEFGNRLFVCTDEPSDNLWYCLKENGTAFTRIDCKKKTINCYCQHSGGILFGCVDGVYSLDTQSYKIDDTNEYETRYVLRLIEHDQARLPTGHQNITAVGVNENSDTVYVGTSAKSIWSGFFVPSQGALNHVIFSQNAIQEYTKDENGETIPVTKHPHVNNFGILRRNSYTLDNDTVALTDDGLYQTGEYSNVLQNYHLLSGKDCRCSLYINSELLIGTTIGVYTLNDEEHSAFSDIRNKTIISFTVSNQMLYVTTPLGIYVYALTPDSPYYVYRGDSTITPPQSARIKKSFIYSTPVNGQIKTYIIILTEAGRIELLGFPTADKHTTLFPDNDESGTASDAMINPGSLVLYYVVDAKLYIKVLYGITSSSGSTMLNNLETLYGDAGQQSKVSDNCVKIVDHIAVFKNKVYSLINRITRTFSEDKTTFDIIDFARMGTSVKIGTATFSYICLIKNAVNTYSLYGITSALSTQLIRKTFSVDAELNHVAATREFVILTTASGTCYYASISDLLSRPNDITFKQFSVAKTPIKAIAATYDYFWALAGSTLYEYSGESTIKNAPFALSTISDLKHSDIIDIRFVPYHKMMLVLTKTSIYAIRTNLPSGSGSTTFAVYKQDIPVGITAHSLQFQLDSDQLAEESHDNVILLMTTGGIYRYYLHPDDPERTFITPAPGTDLDKFNVYSDIDTYGYIDSLDMGSYILTQSGILQVGQSEQSIAQIKSTPTDIINFTFEKSGERTIDEIVDGKNTNGKIIANSATEVKLLELKNDSVDILKSIQGDFASLEYQTTPAGIFATNGANTALSAFTIANNSIVITPIIDMSTGSAFIPTDYCADNEHAALNDNIGVAYAIAGKSLYSVSVVGAQKMFDITTKLPSDLPSEMETQLTSSTGPNASHIDVRYFDDVLNILVVFDIVDGTKHRYCTIKYKFESETTLSKSTYYIYEKDFANRASPSPNYGPSNSSIYFATTDDSVFYTSGNMLIHHFEQVWGNDVIIDEDGEEIVNTSDSPDAIEHVYKIDNDQIRASKIYRAANGQLFVIDSAKNQIVSIPNKPKGDIYDDDTCYYNFKTKTSPILADIAYEFEQMPNPMMYDGAFLLASVQGSSTDSALYYYTDSELAPKLVADGKFDYLVESDYFNAYVIGHDSNGKRGLKLITSDGVYSDDDDDILIDTKLTVTDTKVSSDSGSNLVAVRFGSSGKVYAQKNNGTNTTVEVWTKSSIDNSSSESYIAKYSSHLPTTSTFIDTDSCIYNSGRNSINTALPLLGIPAQTTTSYVLWIGAADGQSVVEYETGEIDHLTKTSFELNDVLDLRPIKISEDGGIIGILKHENDEIIVYDVYATSDSPESLSDEHVKLFSCKSTSVPSQFSAVGETYAFKIGTTWQIVEPSGRLTAIPLIANQSASYNDIALQIDDIIVATSKGLYKIVYETDYNLTYDSRTTAKLEDFNSSHVIDRLIGYSYGTDNVVIIKANDENTGKVATLYSFADDEFTDTQCMHLMSGSDTLDDIQSEQLTATELYFDSNQDNSNTKLVIALANNDERQLYYGPAFDKLSEYPDMTTLTSNVTINQVDTLNKTMYIFTSNGLYYTEGFKDVTKFIKVSTINSDDCYTWHNIDNVRYFMTTDSGLKVVNNVTTELNTMLLTEFNAAVPSSATYPVVKYIPENSGTPVYVYPVVTTTEKSIRQSKNSRRWKRLIDLHSLDDVVSTITGVFVRNKSTYYIGTDHGLYMTGGQYDVTNDIKKLSEEELDSIYQSEEISKKFNDIYSDKLAQHISNHHGGIMTQINKMVSADFSGINLSEWTGQQLGSTICPCSTENDLIETCSFGTHTDNTITVKAKGTISSQLVSVNFNYILKKSVAANNELLIYIPTTESYYLGHNQHTPGCTKSANQSMVRDNLIGIYDKSITSGISVHATKFEIFVPKSLCNIRSNGIINVQANGNSLPLKIYVDHSNYDTDGEAALLYHSFIEPTIYQGASDSDKGCTLTFSSFGSDAQAIRIMFIG